MYVLIILYLFACHETRRLPFASTITASVSVSTRPRLSSASTVRVYHPYPPPAFTTIRVHDWRPPFASTHTHADSRPLSVSSIRVHRLHPLTLTPIYHRQARKKAAQAISKANRKTRAAARNATHAAAALPDSEHSHPEMSAPPLTARQARKKAAQAMSKAKCKARATARNATHAAAALPEQMPSSATSTPPGVTEHELEEVERYVLSLCPNDYKLWWDSAHHLEKLESEIRAEEERQFTLGWKEKSCIIAEQQELWYRSG